MYYLVYDDGSCKHFVALLFALNSFHDRHKDRGTEVCTDRVCGWDKPRQTSNPVTIDNLQFRKKGNNCDRFKPISTRIDRLDVRSALISAFKSYGSVYLHTIESPSDDEDTQEYPSLIDTIKLSPKSQTNVIENKLTRM